MSYYYNYYLGYKFEDKFYPFGPFDIKGHIKPIISRSKSFASDWHEYFNVIKNDNKSEELKAAFPYDDQIKSFKFELIKDKDCFIKKGYYLIKDVATYENSNCWWDQGDLFANSMSAVEYAESLKKEMLYKNSPLKAISSEENEESFLEYPSPASEYMYYAYPNFYSKEYEMFLISEIATTLIDYNDLPQGAIIMVLETEG